LSLKYSPPSAYFDHAFEHFDDRHVERAAAQVEHQERLLLARLDAEGERGGGRLVDQPLDLEAGQLARAAGGLTLAIVEISGHGDHRAGHFLAKECFGIGLERLQHQRGEFLRIELAFAQRHRLLGADIALERRRGLARMGGLPLARGHADIDGAILVHADRAGGQEIAQRIGHQHRFAIAPDRDGAVGRAQIDTDNH
jgi:hypothetical protein